MVLSPAKAVPLANCTAPVPPTERVEPPVERQVPEIEKHPAVRLIPLAKVEVDVSEVALKMFAESPAAKVDVPCPAPTVIAAAKVEVAEVEVAFITLNCPREPKWFTANRLVVLALVPVAETKVKFWKMD